MKRLEQSSSKSRMQRKGINESVLGVRVSSLLSHLPGLSPRD